MAKFIDNLIKRVERNFLVANIQLQAKAQSLGVFGMNAQDGLRDFNGAENGWEAPPNQLADFQSNAIGMVQKGISDFAAPTLLQYQQLEKAEEMLAESPTGRALLESSAQGHVLTRLDTQINTQGAYSPATRILAINPAGMDFSDGARGFRSSMAHVLGHEHFHAFQQRTHISQQGQHDTGGWRGAGFADLTQLDPRDMTLNTMHVEAAAHATEVQIAFELKDNHPQVLASLRVDPDMARIADAYESAATSDPQAVTSGRALRAAHDEWFNPQGKQFHRYQGRSIAVLERGLDMLEEKLTKMPPHEAAAAVEKMGKGRISVQDMKHAGLQPSGRNHMDLPGSAAPNSPQYTNAFLPVFEKDLSKAYDRMDGLRQKFSPPTPAPGIAGPKVATSIPSAPKMGGGKMGA